MFTFWNQGTTCFLSNGHERQSLVLNESWACLPSPHPLGTGNGALLLAPQLAISVPPLAFPVTLTPTNVF